MNRVVRYAFLTALVAAVWSCTEELPLVPEVPQDNPQEKPKVSTSFSIEKIEYSHVSAEWIAEPVKPKLNDKLTVRNYGDKPVQIVFKHYEHAYETVTFTRHAGPKLEITGDGRMIRVPGPLSHDDFLFYEDGWSYREGEQEQIPKSGTETTYTVLSRNELKVTPAFYQSHVSADYTLYLKGDEYGEEQIVEGRFDGRFVVGYDTKAEWSEI